jgi:hypothetical protein
VSPAEIWWARQAGAQRSPTVAVSGSIEWAPGRGATSSWLHICEVAGTSDLASIWSLGRCYIWRLAYPGFPVSPATLAVCTWEIISSSWAPALCVWCHSQVWNLILWSGLPFYGSISLYISSKSIYLFFYLHRASLCSPGWCWTLNLPALAFWAVAWQICTITAIW